MKELYNAPELEMVTFVPVEQLANGYLEGYVKAISGPATRNGGESEGDIDVSIDSDEGTP